MADTDIRLDRTRLIGALDFLQIMREEKGDRRQETGVRRKETKVII